MNQNDVWIMYFLTIVGWQYHPAHQKYKNPTLTLEQSAEIADQMMKITKERL
jgi:hypothetical protein